MEVFAVLAFRHPAVPFACLPRDGARPFPEEQHWTLLRVPCKFVTTPQGEVRMFVPTSVTAPHGDESNLCDYKVGRKVLAAMLYEKQPWTLFVDVNELMQHESGFLKRVSYFTAHFGPEVVISIPPTRVEVILDSESDEEEGILYAISQKPVFKRDWDFHWIPDEEFPESQFRSAHEMDIDEFCWIMLLGSFDETTGSQFVKVKSHTVKVQQVTAQGVPLPRGQAVGQ